MGVLERHLLVQKYEKRAPTSETVRRASDTTPQRTPEKQNTNDSMLTPNPKNFRPALVARPTSCPPGRSKKKEAGEAEKEAGEEEGEG